MSRPKSVQQIMKSPALSGLLAAAMTLTMPAHADIGYVYAVAGDMPVCMFGQCTQLLDGAGTLALSFSITSMLGSSGLSATSVAPAATNGVEWTMPAWGVLPKNIAKGDVDVAPAIGVTDYGLVGGFTIVAGEGSAAPGARLSVKDVRVSLESQSISAALGIGDASSRRVNLWTYSAAEGDGALSFTQPEQTISHVLSGLKLTPEASAHFQQIFQLNEGQMAQLGQDWGQLTLTAHLRTEAPAVPEPATWLLLGVGVCGLSALQRRRHPVRGVPTHPQ